MLDDKIVNIVLAATHNAALIAVGLAMGNIDNVELVCTGDGKPFISDRLPDRLIKKIEKAFKSTGIQLVKLSVKEDSSSDLILPN